MIDPQSGAWPPSAFLKAWDEYVGASQVILERLQNPAAGGTTISPPLFGAWQELAKSMGMNSEFMAGALKPEEMIASVVPALGFTREYQGIVQRMMDLGSRFQRRYAEFLKQGAGISEQALQAVQKRAAQDPALAASPAAAYEAWIDSAESAYAQAAHSEAFARALGELCNLLSAFKVERGKLLESLAKHLDLPSRAEIDSLHRKVHELSVAREAAAASPPKKRQTRQARKPAGK